MIGIPILDNLSEEDLVRVAKGYLRIDIAEVPPLQLSIDPIEEPIPQKSFKLMNQNVITTLCKMEIESRLGWIYLKEKLEELQ